MGIRENFNKEVERFELRRFSALGMNMDYEEKKADSQDLNFTLLEEKLKDKAGIKSISLDILKTLNLYNKDGYYNIAAQLLADENEMEFSGIDVVRFGKDINHILYRETINKKSLLSQYDRAIELFEQYYQYEDIKGYERIKKELIPREAFREAVANAIVHRGWDVNSFIQISMYEDRIEIKSPGRLPEGISKDEYLYRTISVLRNPIIAGVFFRLNIIEQFGTGIARINKEYEDSLSSPRFEISENNIFIYLPFSDINRLDLTEDRKSLLKMLRKDTQLSSSQLSTMSGFSKQKTIRILNSLIDKNIIEKSGKGPSTSYSIK